MSKEYTNYEALVNGKWHLVTADNLLFHLIPNGLVTAWRKTTRQK